MDLIPDSARTAIVTGGTGGLGAAVVRDLLAHDWRVVVPWVAERELSRLEDHDALELVRADLSEPESVAGVVARAGPGLRAVVNLVGGFAAGGRVHETPMEDFDAQMRANLLLIYQFIAGDFLRRDLLKTRIAEFGKVRRSKGRSIDSF